MTRPSRDPDARLAVLVARDLRAAAKHAAAAVLTFTRWSVLLEHDRARAETLIRQALVSAKREGRANTVNPFVSTVAGRALARLSSSAGAECEKRAECRDQEVRGWHDRRLTTKAVEVTLCVFGRGLPVNAQASEFKAYYNLVESITSAALSNDYRRNAEALRGLMAGTGYQAAEEKQHKRNSAKSDGNVVEVEFGGLS